MIDLQNPFLRKGIRVAVVVSLTFFVAQQLFDWSAGSLSAVFACFSMLVFADFGGPRWHRFSANLLLGLNGVILVTLGSVISQWEAASIIATFVIVFCIAYAAVLRGYFAAATAAAILPFAYGVTAIYEPVEILPRSAGWAAGALIAAVASITILPTYARSELRLRLADVLEVAAKTIATMDSSQEFCRCADEMKAKLSTMRDVFNGRLARPGGVTRRDRAMMLAVDEASRLAMTLTWTDVDPTKLGPIDTELMQATAATLSDCARALRDGDVIPEPADLDKARAKSAAAIESWCEDKFATGAVAQIRPGVEASAHVRLACLSAQAMAVYVRGAMDPQPSLRAKVKAANTLTLDAITFQGQTLFQDPKRVSAATMLRDHFNFASPWLLTALRTATALTLTVIMVTLIGAEHGFWLVLGAFVALKFDASGTLRTAAQVLFGTVAGFAVGLVFLELTAHRPTLMWLALPLLAFLATYTPSAVSLLVGQASFTVFVIDLVGITTPDRLAVAEWRLADVVLGIAVSLVVSLLMWPHGVVPRVLATVRSSVRMGTAFLAYSYEMLADGISSHRQLEHVKARSLRLSSQATETFDLAYSQRGPGMGDTQVFIATLNVAMQLNHSAEVVSSLARIDPLPPSMAATGDAMLAAAHRVGVRIVSAVDVLAAESYEDAMAAHDIHRGSLDRLRTTLDLNLAEVQEQVSAAGDGFDQAAKATLAAVFGVVWIAQSVWVADALWKLVDESRSASATV